MSQQVKIDLLVGADVSKAKKEFAELSKALSDVVKSPLGSDALFDDVSLRKAS